MKRPEVKKNTEGEKVDKDIKNNPGNHPRNPDNSHKNENKNRNGNQKPRARFEKPQKPGSTNTETPKDEA